VDAVIGGHVEPGFEAVRQAFAANFEDGTETGAAFCLHVGGRNVVDLHGGLFAPEGDRLYDRSTLQLVFSSTKGATAACANLLAQRGDLDLQAPVARYWPEFAQGGKEDIPVLLLLTHQAGLPAVDASLRAEDVQAWEPVVAALAAQVPFWEPGTAHGYHAVSYGYLVGEVIRRVTGRTLGTFFAEEIAGPLGLEFWIGLPEEEEPRVSPIVGTVLPQGNPGGGAGGGDDTGGGFSSTLLARALNLGGAFSEPGWANQRAWHAAEVPAANGITNATSLSRLYAGLIGVVEGGPSAPILTPAQVDQARTVRTSGADQVFASAGFPMQQLIGQGFWRASPFSPFGGEGSFGHTGAGGSYGFADPENELAVGYVMNKMFGGNTADPRSRRLVGACYESLGVVPKFV
jgi:CubicO group peptidase (beta-lactamase class C family)